MSENSPGAAAAVFRTRVRCQTEGEHALSPEMLTSRNAWLPESLDDGLCQGQWGSVWSGEDKGRRKSRRIHQAEE